MRNMMGMGLQYMSRLGKEIVEAWTLVAGGKQPGVAYRWDDTQSWDDTKTWKD